MSKYKVTIGLEVHVALKTKSKLFSRSSSDFQSNSFSLFDAGLPGMMPVLSDTPVKMALAFAYSVGSKIPDVSIFERKHYFYADLPLGYQITQQNHPIMIGGLVPIVVDGLERNIIIEHAHLECDAAKSLHDLYSDYTAIDLTRCATPLLEIVSTPCMHSPKEAKVYAQTVCELVKFLGICDGKLEEGSFRVDASISLSATEKLGTRVEIKNISSFGFLETALLFEIERQTQLLDQNTPIDMETRLFDENTLSTKSMRQKETVHEYRYMPDPDILPLVLSSHIHEEVLTLYRTDYFKLKSAIKKLLDEYKIEADDSLIAKMMTTEVYSTVLGWLKKELTLEHQISVAKLLLFWAPEIYLTTNSTKCLDWKTCVYLAQSGLQAKECKSVLESWMLKNAPIESCMPQFSSEDDIRKILEIIISSYPQEVEKYRQGQEKILQFLIGKAMIQIKGKSPAHKVKELMLSILD